MQSCHYPGERVWIYDAYLKKKFFHGTVSSIETSVVDAHVYLVKMDDPKLPNLARVSGDDLVFMQPENACKEIYLRDVAPAHPRALIKPITITNQ